MNKCLITPKALIKATQMYPILDENPISSQGASTLIALAYGKLPNGHYNIEFPEFNMSQRFLIGCCDMVAKRVKNKEITLNVKSGAAVIASRIKFDEVLYEDMNGDVYPMEYHYGKTIEQMFEWSY